ncbi:MAG: hypothetical protein WAO35_09440 [Terriglobia bacterium]
MTIPGYLIDPSKRQSPMNLLDSFCLHASTFHLIRPAQTSIWRSRTSGILVILLVAGVAAFAAPAAQAPATAKPLAEVTVQTDNLGRQIPKDFAGLSLEVSTAGQGLPAFQGGKPGSLPGAPGEQTVYALGYPDAPNSGYFQFMRNLGPGILRLGGNSQDNSCWDPTHAPHPEACEAVLAGPDLALFSKAAAASNWKLILGLNLKQNSAAWVLREVTQGVSREIDPSQLFGLEIGNEPDLFTRTPYRPKTYSPADQAKDFLAYVEAFQSDPVAKPHDLVGPATCCGWRNPRDLGIFIDGVGAHSLKLLTVHNYSLTTCNGRTVTIAQLLAPYLMERYNREVKPLVGMADQRGLPIAMAETNSASCGGMPGVSNAFAAALWGMDYMFSTAQDGFRAINFHSSYRPGGSSYNPVDTYGYKDSSQRWHYRNIAQPLYYGMYLFARHASGNYLLATSIRTSANIHAYAVTSCATCAVNVFVINEDLNASGLVRIHIHDRKGKGSLLLLDAPSLSSPAQEVRIGGSQFDSQGNLPAPHISSLHPDAHGDYTFTLPKASAALMMVQGAADDNAATKAP